MQRTPSLTALFLAGAVALPAPGFAQAPACTQMQVFLSIAPKHREHVMDYIAPRLKQKLGVELVAEAIGSANMVERVTAQMPNLAHLDRAVGCADRPYGVRAGLCAPIDLERALNAKRLYDWAYTKNAQGQVTVMATNVLGVGIIYNEEEFRKKNMVPPASWADLKRPDIKGRSPSPRPRARWARPRWSC